MDRIKLHDGECTKFYNDKPAGIKVKINVGGRNFTTLRSTLLMIPGSRLGEICSKLILPKKCKTVYLYFDRDPTLFNAILGCYRDGQMHVPQHACVNAVLKELEFWGISRDYLAPCCLYWTEERCGQQDTLQDLDKTYYIDFEAIKRSADRKSKIVGKMARVWIHLEYPSYSLFSKVWAILVSLIATFSVFTISLSFSKIARTKLPESQHINISLSGEPHNDSEKWKYFYEETRISVWLLILDLALNAFLTLEFLLRFITIPNKCMFFRSFNNWLDLITIAPYWALFSPLLANYHAHAQFILVVQIFMMLRIFKLNRLASVFGGLRVLIILVRKNVKELLTLVLLFLLGMLIYGLLIFEVEIQESAKEQYPNIATAYWWAIVTMTTVGFGDFYPATYLGYVVGGLCAMSGLLLTGMIIPVLGNNFTIYYNYANANTKKKNAKETRAKSLRRKRSNNLMKQILLDEIDGPQTAV